MKLVVFLSVLAAIASLSSALSLSKTSHNDLLLIEWNEFKQTHNKLYGDSAEEDRRFQIYLNTRLAVAKHNHEYALGRQSYRQKINKFADILTDELVGADNESNWINFKETPNVRRFVPKANVSDALPESIDWRLRGAVTPVETQGDCDSSWAFATAGTLEAYHMLKRNDLAALSVQQLIDCSKENIGCNGGDVYHGLLYVMLNGGLQDSYTYPYTGKEGNCTYNWSNQLVDIGSFVRCSRTEKCLKEMVATSPTAANIIVTDSFRHYDYGVYSNPNCNRGKRQSILVVGYGTNYEEGDYWIVKNSWGRDWGEFGYIRVARTANNMCGISDLAVQP